MAAALTMPTAIDTAGRDDGAGGLAALLHRLAASRRPSSRVTAKKKPSCTASATTPQTAASSRLAECDKAEAPIGIAKPTSAPAQRDRGARSLPGADQRHLVVRRDLHVDAQSPQPDQRDAGDEMRQEAGQRRKAGHRDPPLQSNMMRHEAAGVAGDRRGVLADADAAGLPATIQDPITGYRPSKRRQFGI